MSDARKGPTLIPPHVTVGRKESVVLEFPRELPTTGFITLAFYDEMTKSPLGSVPTAQLGPKALKANFPGFSRAGTVEVRVQIVREESPHFPRFPLPVISPVEAIYKVLPLDEGELLPLLSSLLTYLAHCDESDAMNIIADRILSTLLLSVNSTELHDWRLGPLLSGKSDWDDNLLHFCMRRGLSEMAQTLLQPRLLEGKSFYLLQKASHDNKTPIDLARRKGMTQVVETAESLVAGKRTLTPNVKEKNKKKSSFPQSGSVDANLHLMVEDQDPVSPVLGTPKKKEKGGNKLKRFFGKDKEAKGVASPQRPSSGYSVHDDFDSSQTYSETASISSQIPISPDHLHHPDSAPFTSSYSTNGQLSVPFSAPPGTNPSFQTYSLAGVDDNLNHDNARQLPINRDQPMPLPKSQTLDNRLSSGSGGPSDFKDLGPPLSRDLETQQQLPSSDPLPPGDISRAKQADGNVKTPPLGPHNEKALKGRNDHKKSSSLSEAIDRLKKQYLYMGAVTRDYQWQSGPAGTSSNSKEFSVKVGDKVYVVEEKEKVCAGVCKNHYREFPKEILRPLTNSEVLEMNSDGVEDKGSGPSGDEEDIYRVPRNVPRLNESLSEDEEEIYKVPRSILRAVESDADNDDGIYKVPRNIIRPLEAGSGDEEDIYKVPKNIPLVADTDSEEGEHEYEEPLEATTAALSERKRNNLLHTLPEGHYEKVPSRQMLERYSMLATSGDSDPIKTGSSALDQLMGIAAKKKNPISRIDPPNECDDIYDYPPSPPSSPCPPVPARQGREVVPQSREEEEEEEGENNIYDYPPSSPTLDTNRRSHKPPIQPSAKKESITVSAHSQSASDPVEIVDGNIYDCPIDPITSKEPQNDNTLDEAEQEFLTLYDELLDDSKNTVDDQTLTSAFDELERLIGEDDTRCDSKLSSEGSDIFSPRVIHEIAHANGPRKLPAPPPSVPYDDTEGEYDQLRSGNRALMAVKLANPPVRRKYEDMPSSFQDKVSSNQGLSNTETDSRSPIEGGYGVLMPPRRPSNPVTNQTPLEIEPVVYDTLSNVMDTDSSKSNFPQSKQVSAQKLHTESVSEHTSPPLPPPLPSQKDSTSSIVSLPPLLPSQKDSTSSIASLPPPPPSQKDSTPSIASSIASQINAPRFEEAGSQENSPSFPRPPGGRISNKAPIPNPKPKPIRRARAPSEQRPPGVGPVPKPRRHMTDTSVPSSSEGKSQSLNRLSDLQVEMDNRAATMPVMKPLSHSPAATKKAKVLTPPVARKPGRSHEVGTKSPELPTKERDEPPALGPKPHHSKSPELSASRDNQLPALGPKPNPHRSPELPSRDIHSPTVGPKLNQSPPTVAARSRNKPNGVPNVSKKPSGPPVTPKTHTRKNAGSTENLPPPPNVHPKPLPTKRTS